MDSLELAFQRNRKPNRAVKNALAEEIGVDIARINVRDGASDEIFQHISLIIFFQNWFQNRRAKQKQMKWAAETESRRKSENVSECHEEQMKGECDYRQGTNPQTTNISGTKAPFLATPEPADLLPAQQSQSLSTLHFLESKLTSSTRGFLTPNPSHKFLFSHPDAHRRALRQELLNSLKKFSRVNVPGKWCVTMKM